MGTGSHGKTLVLCWNTLWYAAVEADDAWKVQKLDENVNIIAAGRM